MWSSPRRQIGSQLSCDLNSEISPNFRRPNMNRMHKFWRHYSLCIWIIAGEITWVMHSKKIKKGIGDNTPPCGTLAVISHQLRKASSERTHCVRPVKYDLNHVITGDERLREDKTEICLSTLTELKALLKCKSTKIVRHLSSMARRISSDTFKRAVLLCCVLTKNPIEKG